MEREGLLGQDTGWQKVVNRRKKQARGDGVRPVLRGGGRLDVATSATKISYKDTISFFFSEFPETHGAKEMLKAFEFYGEAMEVVIPPKRDKRGKRFGFVRFQNVEEPRVFAVKLDNIIFGADKIHVNLPKFQREWHENSKGWPIQQQKNVKSHGEVQRSTHQQQPLKKKEEPQKIQKGGRQQLMWRKKEEGPMIGRGKEKLVWEEKKHGASAGREGENQYKRQKPSRRWNVKHDLQNIVYHRKNNIAEVCYSVSEEEMQKYKKMFVGTVRTPGSTYSVHEWFNTQGFFSLKITPLGANKVLMEEVEEGVFQELMTNYKE